jgi:hypothetical protein
LELSVAGALSWAPGSPDAITVAPSIKTTARHFAGCRIVSDLGKDEKEHEIQSTDRAVRFTHRQQ